MFPSAQENRTAATETESKKASGSAQHKYTIKVSKSIWSAKVSGQQMYLVSKSIQKEGVEVQEEVLFYLT